MRQDSHLASWRCLILTEICKTMSDKIVQLNEAAIKNELKKLVRGSVEETFDELLEAEAKKLTQAARYERDERRQGYRSGHWSSSRLWSFWTLYAAIGIIYIWPERRPGNVGL